MCFVCEYFSFYVGKRAKLEQHMKATCEHMWATGHNVMWIQWDFCKAQASFLLSLSVLFVHLRNKRLFSSTVLLLQVRSHSVTKSLMYAAVTATVRIKKEGNKEFECKVRVHQASVLSPQLFAIVFEAVYLGRTL